MVRMTASAETTAVAADAVARRLRCPLVYSSRCASEEAARLLSRGRVVEKRPDGTFALTEQASARFGRPLRDLSPIEER